MADLRERERQKGSFPAERGGFEEVKAMDVGWVDVGSHEVVKGHDDVTLSLNVPHKVGQLISPDSSSGSVPAVPFYHGPLDGPSSEEL